MNPDEFATELDGLKAQHVGAVDKIDRNRNLSDVGKAEQVEKATARYRADLAGLQAHARDSIATDRASIEGELTKARAAAAQRRRDTLGLDVIADIEARRLALLDSPSIVEAVKDAADDTDRLLLADLAAVELAARQSDGAPAEQAARASQAAFELQRLTADPAIEAAEARRRQLAAFEDAIARADPGYMADLKMRYNLA